MVLAGEASGDALGAALVRVLQPERVAGMVGPRLLACGVEPFAGIEGLSRIGLGVGSPRALLELSRSLERQVAAFRPDVVLTIDCPSFLLRLAPRLTVPVLHWVSPQVWAWRAGRVNRIARAVDGLATLLPFEPRLYAGTRLDVRFTGHPAALAVPRPRVPGVVGVAAGSRDAERRRLGPLFRQVLAGRSVVEAVPPGCSPIFPESPRVEDVSALNGRVSVALACSGTATLQLAVAGIPHVAAYQTDRFSYGLGRRVLRVPSIVLPNLVLGAAVVPEFVQHLDPGRILSALEGLEGAAGERQIERFTELRQLLRPEGSVERVADWLTALALK